MTALLRVLTATHRFLPASIWCTRGRYITCTCIT